MRRRPAGGMAQGAGWLFADLLLVLAVIALGGQWAAPDTGDRGGEGPAAGPTASRVPSPGPSGTTEAARPGLDPDSEEFTVTANAPAVVAGEAGARRALRAKIADAIEAYPGRTAALVIIWGTAGSCGSCPVTDSASRVYARTVAGLLPSVAPRFFPAYDEDIIRGYRNTTRGRAPGTATIELFFLRS
ncbi:hypothetical protein [Streptomyces sp. CAU 1734]|uniref:hypothetical protein n=1 Tax=Streptomyces sp. CAU 1734 TaxID=3140360 RepID=UPI00326125CB